MLYLKNDLGWRLEKKLSGYIIRNRNARLTSLYRNLQFYPVYINILFVVCLWLGRDRVMYFILCAIVGLLILGLMDRGGIGRLKGLIMGLLIFGSLVVRDYISAKDAAYCIPFTLLLCLWFLRPGIVGISPLFRLVTLSDMVTQIPFSMLKIETDVSLQTGRHQVFLRNKENFNKDLEILSWESNSEAEAYQIAEKLRTLGIGK